MICACQWRPRKSHNGRPLHQGARQLQPSQGRFERYNAHSHITGINNKKGPQTLITLRKFHTSSSVLRRYLRNQLFRWTCSELYRTPSDHNGWYCRVCEHKINDKHTNILHRDGLTSLNMTFLGNVKSKNATFVSMLLVRGNFGESMGYLWDVRHYSDSNRD